MNPLAAAWTRHGGALTLAVVAAAYLGVATAGLVWDDRALVLGNAVLDAPTWRGVFLSDLWAGTGDVSPYHRPLMTLSLLIDRHLLGGATSLAHLHSLGWHLACVALVIRLFAGRVGGGRAAVAGLVFGLHPVQSEAVVWLAARNDLLATAFLLAALHALDAHPRRGMAACAAALALLSKESAILLPVVYAVWRFAWKDRVRGWDLAAICAGLAAVLLLRQFATLGDFRDAERVRPDHAFGPIWAGIRWLGWCVWPWPLTATATVYATPSPTAFVSAACAGSAFLAAIVAAPRRAVGLGVFFGAALAPAMVTVAGTSMLGERYLYLPLVAFAGLVATAPDSAYSRLAALIFAVLSLLSLHLRLPDWVDDVALFGAAAQRAPDGFSLWLYGNALARADRSREAFVAYEASVNTTPRMHFGCAGLATTGASMLDDATFYARLPAWEAAGCRAATGFDDAVFWRLAVDRRVDLLATRVESQSTRDQSGRSVAVRGALRLRDGDWTGLMLAAQRHPAGAADYLDLAQGIEASWR